MTEYSNYCSDTAWRDSYGSNSENTNEIWSTFIYSDRL